MKHDWRHSFNWKLILLRIVTNGLALAIAALILPNIKINLENPVLTLLVLAVSLLILNAVVKPIIQFLTLSLLFVSYGIVVVIINAVMLFLLSWLFPNLIQIDRVLALLLGGAIIGVVAVFLEYVLGITPPIVDDALVEAQESK